MVPFYFCLRKPTELRNISGYVLKRKKKIKADETNAKSNLLKTDQFAFFVDKKIHYLNILNNNSQKLSYHQRQTIENLEKDDCQEFITSENQSFCQKTLFNQQKYDAPSLLEAHNLIIILKKMDEENLQIKYFECEEIIFFEKLQFDELLSLLLHKITEISSDQSKDAKDSQTPEGIICIRLSLLQNEIKNDNCYKIMPLINLLKSCFNYFIFIYSEDSTEVQQKVIMLLQNKLQILGQISINSDGKVSKMYDSSVGRYVCSFANDKENWSDHFEINRNHLFYIDNDKKNITVLVYEELFEYQNLFDALHKIYEDQLILKIFDIQDRLSGNPQKLLYNTNEFILKASNIMYTKKGWEYLFVLAENTERVFINQVTGFTTNVESKVAQYKIAFALRMYSFFGVNAPYCCLSKQYSPSFSINEESTNLKLCLLIECTKECQYFSKSFVSHYKNSKSQYYYYYPLTFEDGPLIGFGSALAAAYLLNDSEFFGIEFQNACFIKKCRFFEFTKLATINVLSLHQNEETDSCIRAINIVLVRSGEETITFGDLCEYDKFEFLLQISKLGESNRFGEEIWNQFINTEYSEQFKNLEVEWTSRIQKITRLLMEDNHFKSNPSIKQTSSTKHNSKIQNNYKNTFATELTNFRDENSIFFTTKQEYVAEATDLGAGGFGVVSIAHLIKDPTKKFALKRLFDNKHVIRDGGAINAGKDSMECNYKEEHDRELEALIKVRRIKSPFLVGYIGAQLLKNETKGTYRLELIMELCNGDLSSYLRNLKRKKYKLSLSECYNIFCQIVAGLRMLHKKGTIHRDIKPQNILYKKILIEGEEVIVWKIGDFGLASMKKEIYSAVGTPEYMAPEIMSNEGYDKAVDVWALGLVFHKILFGYSYYSKNSATTNYKLSSEEIKKVGNETNDLLTKMLERDKKKRIKMDEIHEIIICKNENSLVTKIVHFDELNEREKRITNNFEDGELEKTENLIEISELLSNALEWEVLGCYNKSYNMMMNAFQIIKKSNKIVNQDDQWNFLSEFGKLSFKLKKYSQGLEFFNQSLSICTKIYGEESTPAALIYHNIGCVFGELEKYEEAFYYYNRALKIKINYNGKQHILTASTYRDIGTVVFSLGRYEEALSYYNRALSILTQNYGEKHIETAFAYENFGSALNSLGRYEEALSYYNRALTIKVKQYGEQHVQIAFTHNNIGIILTILGKYEEALAYYNRGLSIKVKHYGDQDIETAPTYANIGKALQLLGKYEEAMTYYNRGLSIFVKQYGGQHYHTATIYDYIGSIQTELGQYEESIVCYNRALLIKVNHYGELHVETALTYNNIGTVLYSLGQHKEALSYYNRVLSIYTQYYGEQHTQTASAYENIGSALNSLGRYEEALSYHNRALSIKVKQYGEQHVQIASTHNNIGLVFYSLGRYEEALTHFNSALSIQIKYYGVQNIRIASTHVHIGNALHSLGKYEEALSYYYRVLPIFVRQYGEQHVHVTIIYNNIGSVIADLGKYEEAFTYFNTILPIEIKHYGEQHAQVALTYNNIGKVLDLLSKYQEAFENFSKALSIQIKHYGGEHVETALTYNNVGNALKSLGKYKEAIVHHNHAVSIFAQRYGEHHIQTVITHYNLGITLSDSGKYEEALSYYYRVVPIYIQHYGEQHTQTASVYGNIGVALSQLGKYEESLAYYNRALSIFIKKHGEKHIQTALIYDYIGSALNSLNQYEEALTYHNRVLSIFTQHYGEKHIQTALTYNNIGNVMHSLGKYKEAVVFYKKALSVGFQHCSEQNIQIIKIYINLAKTLQSLNEYEEALSCYNDTLLMQVREYGEQHVQVALTYSSIGQVLHLSSKYQEAFENFSNALSIQIIHYGGEHVETALTFCNVGNALKSLGKYKEALSYYYRAVPIFIQHYGGQHIQIASVYDNIGVALTDLGKYEEALTHHNLALNIQVTIYGENHVQTAFTYTNIGIVHYSLQEFEKALSYYNRALPIFTQHYGGEHIQTASAYGNIGIVFTELGNYHDALTNFNRALEIQVKHYGEFHVQIALTYGNIGFVLAELGQYEKALSYNNLALRIQTENYGDQHVKTASIHENIGKTLYYMKQYKAALQQLDKAFQVYTDFYGANHFQTLKCFESIHRIQQPLKQAYFKKNSSIVQSSTQF